MFGKGFELNDQTLPVIEQIGSHMPGGFFIYRSEGDGEILYVNEAVIELFGCEDLEDFKEFTGYTFKGMVAPGDYEEVAAAIERGARPEHDHKDMVEYRIRTKDGMDRWVDDYGHMTDTELYGRICYVFLTDITTKRQKMESDMAMRNAVIEALSDSYHTVWLINDIETGTFSLYRGDVAGATEHAAPIKAALSKMKYPQAKEFYIDTTVAPSDRERLHDILSLENISKQIREKSQFNVNYLRTMDDGSERYFRIEFVRLNMPGGRIGVVCGFKDVDDEVREQISMRRALEEAKITEKENARLIEEIESAAKLADFMGSAASLLTNMPAMSFSKDAETGVYLACNQSFAEYAHKETPDGVVGLTDFEIFDEVTAQHFVEDDQKAIGMDQPYIFFEDVPDAAGNPRSFQTTKMKFTDGTGRLCMLGMSVDVTEMTRIKTAEAEAKVRQQELEDKLAIQERLLAEEKQQNQQKSLITALAADYWSVYFIELDKDHGVCYQSHSDVDGGFKVGEEFPYLKSVTDYANAYITDQYREEFLKFIQPEAIKKRLENERVISYRYMVHRHGRETYEMVRFAGVRHPEDRDDYIVHNVGACFTDVDVETRRALQQSEALSDALAAAEEASKAKTTFLSNMSHEIRTPMNAIIGLNNIAMNEPETSAKTREYLEKIDSSAHHLLNIINDILDMSRIESGRMSIKNEEFSFSKLLEQVNTIIGGQCRDKGLHYDCRIKGEVEDYYIGDDMKLRQIMINILGNAVKFTPEGGNINCTVENVARYDGMATLRFIFEDNGIGMSEEFLPKLFNTFSQEKASEPNAFGSTGLGMSITKSLVELMNGTIQVESAKGKGTTFTVTVTLEESKRADNHEIEEGHLHPHEMTVLVIDDDPIAREHAKIVLNQVGISCEAAGSGQEGIDMVSMRYARRDPYDLILVDWKMPEMDGLETTRKIREIVGHDTAIIILTSYNWDDIAEEARSAGVDSFVPKPLFAASVMDEFRKAFKAKNEGLFRNRTDLRGKRVLLAEDVPINAEIMIMILGVREIETELAENGRIAVEMFERSSAGYYDAVLMDMRMPEMDGLEATRLIRSMDRDDARSIPIIALTANAFDEDVQRSMQAGLNAHLSKPVEAEVLYETLESLIKKQE